MKNVSFYVFLAVLTPLIALPVFGSLLIVLLLLKLFLTFAVALALLVSISIGVFVAKASYSGLKAQISKEWLIASILMLIFSFGWFLYNVPLSAEDIFVNRDPAIYTVSGRHLIDNETITIVNEHPNSSEYDLEFTAAGFGRSVTNKDEIDPQGLHMLPALLGGAGKFIGEKRMLDVAPLFGATAILSLYLLMTLYMKPRWAVFGAVSFSLSFPLVYFSRDTFTEPLSATLLLTSLSLLVLAIREKSQKANLLAAAAGVSFGSIFLTRADGLIPGLCAILAILVLSFSGKSSKWRQLYAYFNGGFIPVAALGWLDMSKLSSSYYTTHGEDAKVQLFLLAVVLVSGTLLLMFSGRFKKLKKLARGIYQNNYVKASMVICFILVLAFFISRPFWYVGHDYSYPPGISSFIEGNQRLEGLEVDGTRNYAELTTVWMVWYMGILITVLSVIGLITSWVLVLYKNKKELLLPIAVFLLPSLVYLQLVGITPDHPWASRRFLPVTFPAICFFAFYFLHVVAEYLKNKKGIFSKYTAVVLLIFSALVINNVAAQSKNIKNLKRYANQYQLIDSLCEKVDENDVILWAGDSGWKSIQTARSYCDVPAYRTKNLVDQISLKKFYSFSQAIGKRPVVVITGADYDLLAVSRRMNLPEVGQIVYEVFPGQLSALPEKSIKQSRSLLIGSVNSEGELISFDRL